MKNITVEIGERQIPLQFKMNQFIEIEEEIGNLSDVKELILEGKHRLRNLVTLIRILGNAGLKAAGEEADLTDEWLTENMEPYDVMTYQVKALSCLSKETESEAVKEENEDKERDMVLEEIQQKKDPVNSHTGA